ncbi:hypothetical protein DFR86_02335 [Acidianus sulfidivorans JP7]|uniref:Uncharacterized protein n=1 Tax=Acidianus sulfidivorans JP7 TaxID=619593 RepID=A0A2U9IKG6_9CREN|nr:hypothetical protein [Acidianus sulfidivorans]AWR96503.1 hypothetical protein DFR86_02335 [Acidianus sulfidivorans JP7]
MDYIEVAEKLGIEKEKAIYVYRRLDGGYYMKLYYAKTPILQAIKDWPEQYMKKIAKYPKLALQGYNEAFQILLTIDVLSIIGSSSRLLDLPLPLDKVYSEIKSTYKYIEKNSIAKSIDSYPTETEINFRIDFTPFIEDIIQKRKNDIKANILDIFQDLAYDNDFINELKKKNPWLKAVSKQNILKALSLSEELDNFLDYIQDYIYLLAAERTLYFDKNVLTYGISQSIAKIIDEGKKSKQGEIQNEYQKEVNNIIAQLRESSTYLSS